MTKLVPPTLNINGSDGTDLGMQRYKIIEAIDTTIDAMQRAMPHGRDYLGDTQCDAARLEFRVRIDALRELRSELFADLSAILKQMAPRS